MVYVDNSQITPLYANTSPGLTADAGVVDPAIAAMIVAINTNADIYTAFVTALELPIPDQSIVTRHLRNLAVTNSKLAALAVTADKIADGSITLAKLADLVVTAAKIANGTITEVKMANSSVSRRMIQAGVVGANEIDPTILNPISDATINVRLNQIDEQLAETTTEINNLSINPDTYPGSDYQKLQAAINDACDNKQALRIGRTYDITGNTLMINKEPSPDRTPLYIFGDNGGKIVKNDSGFVFSSTNVSRNTGDIYINGLEIESVSGAGTTVYNGNKLIRVTSSDSSYTNCDSILYSTNFSQSYRFSRNRMIGGQGLHFYSPIFLDVVISDCTIESGKDFLKCEDAASLRIIHNLIENLSGTAIYLKNSTSITIGNNYFEDNVGGYIVFDPTGYANYITVENNVKNGSATTGGVMCVWPYRIGLAISTNNHSISTKIHDISAITQGVLVANDRDNDSTYIGNSHYVNPSMSFYTQVTASSSVTEWGFTTAMANNVSVTIPVGQTMDVSIPMGKAISFGACVTPGIAPGAGPHRIVSQYISGSTVHFLVENLHSAALTLTVRASVMQIRS
jgi:hypothetical protein